MHKASCWLPVLLALTLWRAVTCAAPIPLYSYHESEPFVLKHEPGLSEVFTREFNRLAPATLQLQLIPIERDALNAKVRRHEPLLILWANKLWFQGLEPGLVPSQPLFWDSDVVVSLRAHPQPYQTPADLTGHRIAAMSGHVYVGIDALALAGRLQRIDTENEDGLMTLLQARQVDAMLLSYSTVLYWQKHRAGLVPLYVANAPHDAFSRHILMTPELSGLESGINAVLAKLQQDPQWKQALQHFGIHALVDPLQLDLDELEELPIDAP